MQPATMPMYQPGAQVTQPGMMQPPMMQPGGTPVVVQPDQGIQEESYIENILRFNRGKVGTFYYTVEGSKEWNSVVFRGRVETAGRDHIILSDPKTGKRFLLLMINLSWVEFDEPINYPEVPVPPQIKKVLTTGEMRAYPSAREEE
ncbi:spore coat protein GerQ [Tumebacillus algifaecis]|nr:spore coat protein GerQ [Tumebacillus algifaecis]